MRELLTFIGGMFGELYTFTPPRQEDDGVTVRARHLMRALAEVRERAASFCLSLRLACSCGLTFVTPDELDDHFFEVFVPADDIGLDGRVHVEVDADLRA